MMRSKLLLCFLLVGSYLWAIPGDWQWSWRVTSQDAKTRQAAIKQLREMGEGGLETLLRIFEGTIFDARRDLIKSAIDQVAAQKYATFSRLYWYTDLAKAQRAAVRAGKPILSLHLLGKLDDEFC